MCIHCFCRTFYKIFLHLFCFSTSSRCFTLSSVHWSERLCFVHFCYFSHFYRKLRGVELENLIKNSDKTLALSFSSKVSHRWIFCVRKVYKTVSYLYLSQVKWMEIKIYLRDFSYYTSNLLLKLWQCLLILIFISNEIRGLAANCDITQVYPLYIDFLVVENL